MQPEQPATHFPPHVQSLQTLQEEGRFNQHPSCNQHGGASGRTADARLQMNYSFYVTEAEDTK